MELPTPREQASQDTVHHIFSALAPDQRERMRQMIHSAPFLALIDLAVFPLITQMTARLDALTPPEQTNYARGYKAALTNFVTLVCTFAALPNPLRAPLHWMPDPTDFPPRSAREQPPTPDDLPPNRGSYGSGRPAFPA